MNKNYSYFSAIAVIAIIFVSLNTKLKAYDDWEKIKGPFTGQFTCFGEDMSNHVFAGSWGDGIYQLSGTGTTWTKVSNNLPDPYITCMFIDSTSKIFVGTYSSGVFLSTNFGVSWVSINNGITNLSIKCITRLSNGNYLAGTNGGGVFRTTNVGTIWKEANSGLWYRDINSLIQNWFGTVVAATNGGGFYYSTDTCKTWKRGNSTTSSTGKKIDFAYQMIMQSEGSIYATTPNRGVIFSMDGISWYEQDSVGMTDYNTYAIAINAEKYVVVGTRKSGIFYHNDKLYGMWLQSSTDKFGPEAIIKTSDGRMFAAIPLVGIQLSTNNGKTWLDHSFGTNYGVFALSPHKNGIIYCTHYFGGIGGFVSTDNGVSWNSAGLDTFSVRGFTFDSSNRVIAATTRGIYRSSNNGGSWTKLYDSAAFTVAVLPNGYLVAPGGLNYFRSTDNGVTWSIITITSPLSQPVKPQYVGVNYNGDIYIFGPGQGLYRSTNTGTSYSMVLDYNTLPLCDGISFNKQGHIFIAADANGIIFSTDNFTSYKRDTLGLYPRVVNFITMNSLDQPFASTANYIGLWKKDSINKWSELNSNIGIHRFQCLVSNDRGNIFTSTDAIYTRMDSNKLTVPTLISPPSGTTGLSLSPSFAWSATNNAETYYFEISTDPNFSFAYEFRVQSTTFTNIDRILNYGTKYYWRTRAKFNNVLSAAQ
ncbi:MAG: hypothetical protein NT007_00470, partial [Candidatus Kapabacteria bacterium]|nr:hypothetical protein [Candidatus Kapabacteria bacterium]